MGYDVDGDEWEDAKKVVNNVITGTGYERCKITTSTKFTDGTSYIFAYWVSVKTVTFDLNYTGSTSQTKTVEEGSKVTKITDPTRQGYQFMGWYTDSACTNSYNFNNPVTTNLTLYAKWLGNEVNVSFRYYDESTSSYEEMKSMVVHNGETIKASDIPSVTREGYDFTGWYKGSAATELVSANPTFTYTLDMGTETHLMFTAKYTPQTFTLNFYEDAGGTAISTQTVQYNKTATTVTAAAREGMSFKGWFISTDGGVTLDTEFTFATPVKQNMEIYAKWGVQQVTLTFKTNDGAAWQTYETMDVDYGVVVPTLPENPTKVGEYRFAGWCLDAALTNVVDFTTYIPTTNVTLYALFKEQVTITFINDGGTELGTIKIDKDSPFTTEQLLEGLASTGVTEGTLGSYAFEILNADTTTTVINPTTYAFTKNETVIVYG